MSTAGTLAGRSISATGLGAGRVASGNAYCPEASHSRAPSRTATSLPEAANAMAGMLPVGIAPRICSSAATIFGVDIFDDLSAPATRSTVRSRKVYELLAPFLSPGGPGGVMNPVSLSLRMSAGGRPNSLLRSAREYSCISPHRLDDFLEAAASPDAGAFLGALRS